ncbi:hypothetical protein E3N88_37913 [Mikania micrantha]|uniref:Uncharacterized protein n=1 Tax=Mikania micrantha TaxID=192012 RepID=A0A5N6LSG6_9ASTR|nr:hypothetical protein E3N88_37913 [Mikania micrantha]
MAAAMAGSTASFSTRTMSTGEPVVSVDWLHANLREPDLKKMFGDGDGNRTHIPENPEYAMKRKNQEEGNCLFVVAMVIAINLNIKKTVKTVAKKTKEAVLLRVARALQLKRFSQEPIVEDHGDEDKADDVEVLCTFMHFNSLYFPAFCGDQHNSRR